jgi:glycosyltransferase involved in cell wall biosynthesis
MKSKQQADNPKKSVAIIGTRGYPSYYGGFETAVRKLAPYLADSGWAVTVYGRPGATQIDDPETDGRINRVTTRGMETKSLSTLSYGLTAVLHALVHKPDAAIVMNVANGFWLPLLRLRGIPSVVNVDGIEWKRAKWGRAAKIVFKLGAKFTGWFANELVADSVEIQRIWKQEFNRDSVFIPYGGDVPQVLPVVEGLKRRGYVLVVARFVPENTIGEFFEAVPAIAVDHQVVIVGSSGYGGAFDQAAADLDRNHTNVTWLGHVNDDEKLLSLWQHSGVYFHGHSVGGTNPALVQAMACGAPVVARDTVYNREVLGGLGTFVDPNPSSIAEATRRAMMYVDQGDISGELVKRAQSEYSWRKVCEQYELVAQRLTKGTSKERVKV